ncbi:hypothetical protein BZA77DRAFT_97885 [Pyronema omphalodes]|nr:hypothetical protein BZA77DRAFT_97885 [Pyronema omphalodes]
MRHASDMTCMFLLSALRSQTFSQISHPPHNSTNFHLLRKPTTAPDSLIKTLLYNSTSMDSISSRALTRTSPTKLGENEMTSPRSITYQPLATYSQPKISTNFLLPEW